MCVYATPIDQDYVRKVMNSAVRSSGGKRDEVALTLTLTLTRTLTLTLTLTLTRTLTRTLTLTLTLMLPPTPTLNQVVLGHWSFNEGAGEHCAATPYPYS